MNISNWSYEIVNLENFPNKIFKADNTILANSVIACNYELLKKIKDHHEILEIGCGKYSWLRENLNIKENWKGLEVNKNLSENIATEFGSVHQMPYKDKSFDFILSNQSIEHWSEYNVSIQDGLSEISRCLKENSEAHLNFPFYLHGHPDFVKGRIEKIKFELEKFFFIKKFTAYSSTELKDYKGWRRCGFPDWYIPKNINTSFVVNAVLKKNKKLEKYEKKRLTKIPQKRNIIFLHLRHGYLFFFWKILTYLKKKIKYS